ncbi:MAG: hypothetical protein JW969_16155 [Spirochaetales bacterium]|nr:hypothetical protein [Spirochaetales bacterium]
MKKSVLIVTLGCILLLLLTGCPSTPPPQNVALPEEEYEQAKKLRSKIEKFGLKEYSAEDFQAGETSFKVGEENYNKDNQASKDAFDAAIVSYRSVIRAGLKSLVAKSFDDADKIKQQADTIKANVAVKDDYVAAKEIYDKAKAEMDAGNDEEASDLFIQAKELFDGVYAKAKEKRDKAEKSMAEVSSDMKSLEDRAAELEEDQ